ncbi:DUF4304 domain-containing protein [Roseateles chitinivorans]|uniref:DUF4304 domain-containing protein n=1 Tax=Roseateles chitinivorans TaxID=2917965 RepID=UPI003D670713
MNLKQLHQVIDAALREVLTNEGFRHTAPGTWNRRRGEELNVIELQKRSSENLFCVNLGIHYAFLPKAGMAAPLDDADRISILDCDLKLRLTQQATLNDQWWPMEASSAEQVADLVRSRGLPIFDSYRLDGPIAAMDAHTVESGHASLLATMTDVGACLLLARMHEHLGNQDKAGAAADLGLKLAGRMAVSPKRALRDISERSKRSPSSEVS